MEILQLLCLCRVLWLILLSLARSSLLYSLGTDHTESFVSNSFFYCCMWIRCHRNRYVCEGVTQNGCVYLLISMSLPSSRSTCYNMIDFVINTRLFCLSDIDIIRILSTILYKKQIQNIMKINSLFTCILMKE
jgi:hypothetical protein